VRILEQMLGELLGLTASIDVIGWSLGFLGLVCTHAVTCKAVTLVG
jgi:hypothetical protein